MSVPNQVPNLIKFTYRNTLKTPARTEYLILKVHNNKVIRVKPYHIERSRTGAHGFDYYRVEDVNNADAIIVIDISNSGKHYCSVIRIPKNLEKQKLILKWLEQNEHICPSILNSIKQL